MSGSCGFAGLRSALLPALILGALFLVPPSAGMAAGSDAIRPSAGTGPWIVVGEGDAGWMPLAAFLEGVGDGWATWNDVDGDGDLDLTLTRATDFGPARWVFPNDGNGIFAAGEAAKALVNPVVYEGDRSAGVRLTATANPTEVIVRNLTTDITPAAGTCGVDVRNAGGGGSNGGVYQGGNGGRAGASLGLHLEDASHRVSTTGRAAHGVYADTRGGKGGNGGNAYLAGGGGGGGRGGAGGAVTIENGSNLATAGAHGHGMFAYSGGGRGGNGGSAYNHPYMGVILRFPGGNGGGGGAGGAITLENEGTISTSGDSAQAIFARSGGGGGGTGGNGWAVAGAEGGDGGRGGNGGTIGIVNDGVIVTRGAASNGILAQSVGGSGGNGGDGNGAVGLSGSGAGSGMGGQTTITNRGSITTGGEGAHGILGQSIGGFGGGSGDGTGFFTYGGAGGTGGDGYVVTIDNAGTVVTGGDFSTAVLGQSIGGGGGSAGRSVGLVSVGGSGAAGGDGSWVHVVQSGDIRTAGDHSHGIAGQSIGGGGGGGGGAGALSLYLSSSVGGSGGGGGNGGYASASSQGGSIETGGYGACGVSAQSIGGGGGNGGFAVSAAGGDVGSLAWSVGGRGARGGHGSQAQAENSGTVVTGGDHAHGVLAQSLGGGGGNGGWSLALSGSAGASGAVGIGGQGGAGGNAEGALARDTGGIRTSGDEACAVLAQSIGGGGGDGGVAVTASGAGNAAFSFGVGGSGDRGGSAGYAAAAGTAEIVTEGSESHGIAAQSIGGGGGSGAFSLSLSGAGNGALSIGMGGGGAGGGSGSQAWVDHSGSITTGGDRSYGILVQSIGGGGGDGGGSITASGAGSVAAGASFGGRGGGGGSGADARATNMGSVATAGTGSHGVVVQSVGGGGGAGGFSLGASGAGDVGFAFGFGGRGAAAGSGGRASADHSGVITTRGDRSYGILVQSVGGGGGCGGGGIAVSGGGSMAGGVSFGGSGGAGGSGTTARATSAGIVSTEGYGSHGVVVQSIGGGGGAGGFSIVASGAPDGTVNFGIGGSGTRGGHGGRANVVHSGAVTTAGDRSVGILAQSIGGGGGDGGFSVGATGSGHSEGIVSVTATVGGAGGPGGNADSAYARSTGTVATRGEYSHGIQAQSVGGGGGNGGFSGNITAVANHYVSFSLGGTGGIGGRGGHARVENDSTVVTSGDHSVGLHAQSLGGGGGSGGASVTFGGVVNHNSASLSVGGRGGHGNNGGWAVATNRGALRTAGDQSHGIFAQSVGGGGGEGGMSLNFASLPGSYWNNVFDEPGLHPEELNISVSVGGSGGAGGDGGRTSIVNSGGGDIHTEGNLSCGIYAQSIGGGGGSGAVGIIGTGIDFLNNLLTVWDPSALPSASVGGSGGASGDGGEVEILNFGDITTEGHLSHGIFAQSIGGGGGQALSYFVTPSGDTLEGSGLIDLGGREGASGNGGRVIVDTRAPIETSGDGAYGIFAQSVGGGGGAVGDLSVEILGLRLATIEDYTPPWVSSPDDNTGDGGDIYLDDYGDITTHGEGAVGIFAQSVGGGGGVGGGIWTPVNPEVVGFAGSAGGAGSGGSVQVRMEGTLRTDGDGAHGIVAQSAGGTGTGGSVEIVVRGDILARGADASGIIAQSTGDGGNEWIFVAVDTSGSVQGGTDSSAGVLLLGGSENIVRNLGTITTLGGLEGRAIVGTSGDETIDNYGTIVGSVELGDGVNRFDNREGARFDPNARIDLGGGPLWNAGTLSPGGASGVMTTELTGSYEQAGTGAFEATLCGRDQDLLVARDGPVTIGGTLRVIAECGAYVDGHSYDLFDLGEGGSLGGAFDEVLLPRTLFLDFDGEQREETYRVTARVTSLASAANDEIEKAIAGCLDECAPHSMGDFSRVIGSFQTITDEKDVHGSFSGLSPDPYDDLTRGALEVAWMQQDALASRLDMARIVADARGHDGGARGKGLWFGGVGGRGGQDGSGRYGANDSRMTGFLGAIERPIGRGTIGASFGTAFADVDREDDRANGSMTGYTGSIYGERPGRRTFAQAVVSFTRNSVENRRSVTVGELEREARSEYGSGVLSALVAGGLRYRPGGWRMEPFASLRFSRLGEDAFTEEGAGDAGLVVDSRSDLYLMSDLGLRVARPFGGSSLWIPELTLAWNHDYGIDDRTITASFVGDPDVDFTIDGREIESDGAVAGLGLLYQSAHGWRALLRYRHTARSDYGGNGLTLQVGSSF